MDPFGNTIASFVPTHLRQRHAASASERNRATGSAAVLFADVSGFTPLAKRLAEHGPRGGRRAESNSERLFRPDRRYGLRLWRRYHPVCGRCDPGGLAGTRGGTGRTGRRRHGLRPGDPATARGFQSNCNRAVRPATERNSAFADTSMSRRARSPYVEVGGVENKWQLVVVGGPLAQLPIADQHTQPGEVVLSPEAAAFAAGSVLGDSLGAGHLQARSATLRFCRLNELATDSLDESLLRRYVPRVVLARLDAGQVDFIGDLRQVSIVFIKLAGIDGTSLAACDRLQTTMEILQSAAQQWNGEVYQTCRGRQRSRGNPVLWSPPSDRRRQRPAGRAGGGTCPSGPALERIGLRPGRGDRQGLLRTRGKLSPPGIRHSWQRHEPVGSADAGGGGRGPLRRSDPARGAGQTGLSGAPPLSTEGVRPRRRASFSAAAAGWRNQQPRAPFLGEATNGNSCSSF